MVPRMTVLSRGPAQIGSTCVTVPVTASERDTVARASGRTVVAWPKRLPCPRSWSPHYSRFTASSSVRCRRACRRCAVVSAFAATRSIETTSDCAGKRWNECESSRDQCATAKDEIDLRDDSSSTNARRVATKRRMRASALPFFSAKSIWASRCRLAGRKHHRIMLWTMRLRNEVLRRSVRPFAPSCARSARGAV